MQSEKKQFSAFSRSLLFKSIWAFFFLVNILEIMSISIVIASEIKKDCQSDLTKYLTQIKLIKNIIKNLKKI